MNEYRCYKNITCEILGYKSLHYPLGENADLGFTLIKENDIIIFINTSSRLSRKGFICNGYCENYVRI